MAIFEKYIWNSTSNVWELVETPISQVAGLQGALNGKANLSGATFTGNLLVDGASVHFIRPNTTGGWARAFDWRTRTTDEFPNTVQASVGLYGTNQALNNMYIGMNRATNPWINSQILIHETYVNINNVDLRERGQRVYSPNNKPNWTDITSKPSWIGTNKPNYDLGEISETTTYKRVTQTEKDGWNSKQNPLGFTPENVANKRTSIRTTGANNTSYVSELGVKNYVDVIAATKQDALGYTPVPNTRTIAGLDLTANRSRDDIIGVSGSIGYIRRTGANTYGIRTFANVKSDLDLDNVPNVDATNPANISQTASYRFVTDNEKDSWNNKWKQIYGGVSAALSKTGFTSITVPSDVYVGKTVAVEIRYGSNVTSTYTNKIVFATLGSSSTTTSSKTLPRYITLSDFDGQYLKNISVKCYATTGTTTLIRFGHVKTLIGSFSGTTIDWSTQASDSINVYIGKIWTVE